LASLSLAAEGNPGHAVAGDVATYARVVAATRAAAIASVGTTARAAAGAAAAANEAVGAAACAAVDTSEVGLHTLNLVCVWNYTNLLLSS
jgi:hypothetical protein